MRPYPHAIFYDFEACQDKSQRQQPTGDLVYKNMHVPASVSLGDTLDKTPTHICDPKTKRLVRRFMEELEKHGANIRARVRAEVKPEDLSLLHGKQRENYEAGVTRIQS